MKIIDNKKDYYDFLVGINGLDSDTVFDRRGSIVLKALDWFNYDFPEIGTVVDPNGDFYINPRFPKKRENPRRHWSSGDIEIFGQEDDLCIVLGDKIYGILIDRYIEDGVIGGSNHIIRTYVRDDSEDNATGIIGNLSYDVDFHRIKTGYFRGKMISNNNIILKDTWLSKMFPAQKVWEDIYNFIRSKKDKKIIDGRTDNEKIRSAGFDVKTSFRNIK